MFNKLLKNKYFPKVLVLIFIILVLVIISIIYKNCLRNSFAKKVSKIAEENENSIFTIEKVLMYSSAGINNNENKNLEDLEICQYTDLAIYINNKNYIKEINEKNTVSKLYIDNIKIESDSNKGEKNINYKNILDFGKFKMLDNAERIDFNIIRTNEENVENNYSNPSFYTDCSNPLSLGYVNKNLAKYSATQNDNVVYYDGKVLKNAKINLNDINYNISFKIHIINNINEEFVYDAKINDVLSENDKAIYNGFVAKMKVKFDGGNSFFKLVK